jgi:diaminopimelate epimerase
MDGLVAATSGNLRETEVSGVVFHKLTGSGNDFVMIEGRNSTPEDWPAERISRICDRRHGIGADGLVIIDRTRHETVSMAYFNSDGSPASMCGNAALCTTRLAAELELADPGGMTLTTGAGEFTTRCISGGDLAELNLPDTDLPKKLDIELNPGEKTIYLGTVGVPHIVTRVDDIADVDILGRGMTLRGHPACGPVGANANFYSRISSSTRTGDTPETGGPTWALRTYERGIEAETLSCGTGTVTAALALAADGIDELPLRFRSSSGTVLSVSAAIADGRATDIWLCGPGRIVARGVWLE